MIGKIIGGVLLIIGTSIGAGILALPVSTASGGFINSLWLFFAAWCVTVFGAYYILEVNLWLPEKTNLSSMARATLGPVGQFVTWFADLFLLYTLLSAYTTGGSDLINNLLSLIKINTPNFIDAILFVVILGFVIYKGVRIVDITNRVLMILKFTAYFLLVALVTRHVQLPMLATGSMRELGGAIMVVVTSFGYATIIPSLRYYYNSNVKALRITIAIGSLSSLLIYLLWDFAVQGTISSSGPAGLVSMSSGRTVSELTTALSQIAHSKAIDGLAHFFSSICLTTSFLGVGLCLKDFLSDGLKVKKDSRLGHNIVMAVTFIPPLAVAIFYPKAFIEAFTFAGILCIILLILLPALMVWSGRYWKRIAQGGYQFWGGKTLVLITLAISVILTAYGIILIK